MNLNENSSYGAGGMYSQIMDAVGDEGDEPTPPSPGDPGDENDAPQEAPTEKPVSEEVPAEGEITEPKEEVKEEAKKVEAKSKNFKAITPDGKEIELTPETKFIKMVDGEPQEVTLGEALKHHAFNVPYSKRMQEAATKLKEAETQKQQTEQQHRMFLGEVQKVAQQLKTVHQAFDSGDIEGFLDGYAHVSGKNPFIMRSKIREYFIPIAKKWLEADELQRKELDLEEHQAYTRSLEESQQAARRLQEITASQQQYARAQIQQAGISEVEFSEAEQQVIQAGFGGRAPNLTQATPMQVSEYVRTCVIQAKANQHNRKVDGVIAELAPELKESKPEAYKKIRDIIEPFMGRKDMDTIKKAIQALLKGRKAGKQADDEEAVPLDDDTPDQARPKRASKSQTQSESEEVLDGLPSTYSFFKP